MVATPEGGRKAATAIKARYGNDFFQKIGHQGGLKSRGGGFSSMTPERRREVSLKGLEARRRKKIEVKMTTTKEEVEVKR